MGTLAPTIGEEERRDYQAALVLIWLAIPAIGMTGALSLSLMGIECDSTVMTTMLATAASLPGVILFGTARFDVLLTSLCGSVLFIAMTAPVVVLLTYSQAAWGGAFPLTDHVLSRMDGVLGFDWLAVLAWADALARDFPTAEVVAKGAYESIIFQMLVVITALSFTGQHARLQRFLISYVVSLLAVGTISVLVPAVGTYEFYGVVEAMHPNLRLSVKNEHLEDYMSLRNGTYGTFTIGGAKGIVTFPSFHSTLAVIFTWSLWRTPFLRWAGLALNTLMLAATPLFGSHFLVDVVAGAAIAPAAIAVSGPIRNRARGWMGPILRMPSRRPEHE